MALARLGRTVTAVGTDRNGHRSTATVTGHTTDSDERRRRQTQSLSHGIALPLTDDGGSRQRLHLLGFSGRTH